MITFSDEDFFPLQDLFKVNFMQEVKFFSPLHFNAVWSRKLLFSPKKPHIGKVIILAGISENVANVCTTRVILSVSGIFFLHRRSPVH